MDPTWLYAVPMAGLVAGLVLARRRLGRRNAGAWLLVVAAAMMVAEDGALTLWYGLAPASLDPDGAAGLVHPHTQAHMIGAGAWAFLAAALAAVLARGPLRRGERWAWRALAAYFGVGILVDLIAYGALYTHGLPLPVPGNHGGFGWPPVAVAVAAAALGLSLARDASSAPPALTRA